MQSFQVRSSVPVYRSVALMLIQNVLNIPTDQLVNTRAKRACTFIVNKTNRRTEFQFYWYYVSTRFG